MYFNGETYQTPPGARRRPDPASRSGARRHPGPGLCGEFDRRPLQAAGVTKGAFFHHFENKEALGVAAAHHWAQTTSAFFESAPYHDLDDPLDRLLGYVEFRKSIIEGDLAEFTCLVGTMTQEIYRSHPAIREACAASIFGHAQTLEPDIAEAMKARRIKADWTPASLARHTQAVLQGAFILAKATGERAVALESVDHLKRYLTLLFSRAPTERKLT
jgi:TetR/AcrR family transcriptional regulator, transcriptional repressor for nem operon